MSKMEVLKTKDSVTDILSQLETMGKDAIIIITDADNIINDDYITRISEASGLKTEARITSELKKLGFKTSLLGFNYIRYGVQLLLKDRKLVDEATAKFYPLISEEFGVTPMSAERAMRNSIEKAWEIGNMDEMERLFGYSVNITEGKPTVLEFLCVLQDSLRLGLF